MVFIKPEDEHKKQGSAHVLCYESYNDGESEEMKLHIR